MNRRYGAPEVRRHRCSADAGKAHGRRSAFRYAACIIALGALQMTTGCVRYEVVHYAPLTWSLDSTSELHVSSYPSWFPSERSTVPFLHKVVRTPESIYFQLHVRDAARKSGPNPHIQSVTIRSFTYQLPGEPAVQLIADVDRGFWMQDQTDDGAAKPPAVPCLPGQSIAIRVALQLNGAEHAFDGSTECAVRTRTGLLAAHALLR